MAVECARLQNNTRDRRIESRSESPRNHWDRQHQVSRWVPVVLPRTAWKDGTTHGQRVMQAVIKKMILFIA
jgi:hypothetical protein